MKTVHNFFLVCSLLLLGTLMQSCLDSVDSEEDEPNLQPYSHQLNPGRGANDFLADSNFTELVIEIDYMEDYRPDGEALDSLEQFLEKRLNKTSVTILEPTVIPSGEQDSYSANEIRQLEEEHRDEYTDNTADERLTAYMVIVDGNFTNNNVLGIAYYNTSTAFFGSAFEEATQNFGSVSRYLVEATSFRHEFGHLFGLVNIDRSGTDMQDEHQDEENEHHCDNDRCLMYYAVETTNLFGEFFGEEEIPALDENCIADLQANGGK